MTSKPIPRYLLVHSATLAPYTGMSGGAPAYGTSVNLVRVRFDPVKHTAMTSLGDMKNDQFLVFHDCKNSSPASQTFNFKDKITFGAFVLSVRKVVPCYGAGGAVHHYEVYCV